MAVIALLAALGILGAVAWFGLRVLTRRLAADDLRSRRGGAAEPTPLDPASPP